MIARLFVFYALLVLAIALSVASALGAVVPASPWCSLFSLGLVALCVALRIWWKLPERSPFVRWHERTIDRIMLMFAYAGIVSAYQWLFIFGHLSQNLHVTQILQLVSWAIQLLVVAQLGYALCRLLLRLPKLAT